MWYLHFILYISFNFILYIYVIFTKSWWGRFNYFPIFQVREKSCEGSQSNPVSVWGSACQPGFLGHEQNWHLGSNQEVQSIITTGIHIVSAQSSNPWTPDDTTWFPDAVMGLRAHGINQVIQYTRVTGWSSLRQYPEERFIHLHSVLYFIRICNTHDAN